MSDFEAGEPPPEPVLPLLPQPATLNPKAKSNRTTNASFRRFLSGGVQSRKRKKASIPATTPGGANLRRPRKSPTGLTIWEIMAVESVATPAANPFASVVAVTFTGAPIITPFEKNDTVPVGAAPRLPGTVDDSSVSTNA